MSVRIFSGNDWSRITDGNLMLEVNALPDKFCVTFQLLMKDRKPLDLFCDILREEHLPFTVSESMVRYMPDILLPKPERRNTKNRRGSVRPDSGGADPEAVPQPKE